MAGESIMNGLNPSRNLALRPCAGCFLAAFMLSVLLAASGPDQTFRTLYSFTAGTNNSSGVFTNRDGGCPYAGLILSGNTLYGTAFQRGSSGNGTVFAVNTDGTGFTNLHNFTGPPYVGTNSEGASPSGGLILSGNTLYGTA